MENNGEQAGAVLGQAQLKLEMDFTSINLHKIDEIQLAVASGSQWVASDFIYIQSYCTC